MTKDLNFKPLSDGLGFHPFSDGLPYAPVSKRITGTDAETATARARAILAQGAGVTEPTPRPAAPSMGTGAMAAGKPRFASPMPPPPSAIPHSRVNVPIAAGAASGEAAASLARTRMSAAATRAATFAVPAPARVDPNPADDVDRVRQTEFGFGYLFKRILAYGIDTIVNISLCGLGMAAVAVNQNIPTEALNNPTLMIMTVTFLLTFNWALITAQEVIFKTTMAKRLFGLRLHGGAVPLFLRSFFFLPSLGVCGLGVVWAIFDSRRRCWHDHVVDVQPEDR